MQIRWTMEVMQRTKQPQWWQQYQLQGLQFYGRNGGAGKAVIGHESSQVTNTEAGNVEVNETEQMLLSAAMHVKWSDKQREGYQCRVSMQAG